MYYTSVPGTHEGQKKFLTPLEQKLLTDGCEQLCGLWKSNPGYLDNQESF